MSTLPTPEAREPRARVGAAVVLVVLAAGLLASAAAYNGLNAPTGATLRFADIVPLGDGTSASPTSRISLKAADPIVTSHFVLDRGTWLLHPLGGGTPVPVGAGQMDDATADGDNVVWVDLRQPPSVHTFDAAKGSERAVVLPANLTPLPATLSAGDGWTAWSFARSDGRIAAAVLPRGALAPLQFASAFAEDRRVVAVIRTDLFYSKTPDGSDVWVMNTTSGVEARVASGLGVARTATGAFFVAWVNGTAETVGYYDILDRRVESIAPPAEVLPKWVLASGLTILLGGTKPGLVFSSPRVEFYDFGIGRARVYDSIGVDFDATPTFGFADRTVVSYVEDVQPRPSAPLTPFLLLAAILAFAAAAIVGFRQTFAQDDDL